MIIKQDPIYRRRRRVALALLVAVVLLLTWGFVKLTGGSASASETGAAAAGARAQTAPAPVRTPAGRTAPTPSPAAPQGEPGPPERTALVRTARLTGELAPKSVVASSRGQVFAQNMMYQHSVAVFGADGARLATIPDAVDLSRFGVDGHPGTSKGAPVEMAFSPDGRTAWVSNYAMYGAGFSPEPQDSCTGPGTSSRSFLYAIDTDRHVVTRAVQVGVVPKYVAVTPDGTRVLVTNWCSMDLMVIDAASARLVATIPVDGAHPRGIAVSPDSRTAYVAVMGSDKVVAVDLSTREVRQFARTGTQPRHLVISPDGRRLYVTNNGADSVSVVDTHTGSVLRTVPVGDEPRSMTISHDGRALYVVNYGSASVTKLRASDLAVLQTVRTDPSPIGITYEPTRKAVWVACYGGSVLVFDDSRLPATKG